MSELTPSERAMADVDKVAEALCGVDMSPAVWPRLGPVSKARYRAMAVAAIDALDLTEEWSDDVAGPEWQRYRRLVQTQSVAYPGPKRIAAGLT